MTVPANPAKEKTIHVFASDFLPFPGCPTTAGGNRSMQVISALRKAGHKVTFSMPLGAHLRKSYAGDVLRTFSSDELWCSENFFDPEVVLNRMQPDIAIYCNVNCFRTIRRFQREIVHIADLYGPLQFEGLLLEATGYAEAAENGSLLERRCREMVEKFRSIDFLVTVSDRQKYFWSAYCSLAGFSFANLNVLVCPVSFNIPAGSRSISPNLTVVYSGGFYPWQNPDRFLREAASVLERIEGAVFHIYGGPHAGLPNEDSVKSMLEELQRFRCVRYHGYRPAEEVRATLSTAWCALELMERNIERELAITGRTVEFLSTGTPVIYNNYSTLSELIEKYSAGWTVSPSDGAALDRIFNEIARGGPPLVEQISANALRLAAEEFKPETSMAALVHLLDGEIGKRRDKPQGVYAKRGSALLGKVLAISPDAGALAELRVTNPLRSLHRQQFIEAFTFSNARFENLKHDNALYDVIYIQRAVPDRIFLTLRDMGVPFLLDVDDNLLARSAYRSDPPEIDIVPGLRHATAVTVPNPRLVRMLEKYSETPLAHKAFITPNGLPFSATNAGKPPEPPSRIIWIQSDIAALAASRDGVVRAVEDFSRKHSLPIVLIGKNVLARPQFTHQVVMGQMDFASNLQLLELGPPSLGVAPLETVGDQETLDFVAGKSDLKLVLFSGYGHPGVYSAAPPYSDSALQQSGSIIGNTYSEWTAALEYQFTEGWRGMAAHKLRIQNERHVDRIARESWFPAFEACRIPKPVRGSDLYEALVSSQKMDQSALSSLGYMLANEDIGSHYLRGTDKSSWDHFVSHGHAENRRIVHDADTYRRLLSRLDLDSGDLLKEGESRLNELHAESRLHELRRAVRVLQQEVSDLRNSLSWRVTAPLRRVAKPIMETRK